MCVKGVKVFGDKGWLELLCRYLLASTDSLFRADSGNANDDSPNGTQMPHQVNFIEAARTRESPVIPVKVRHRSCTLCPIEVLIEIKKGRKNPAF